MSCVAGSSHSSSIQQILSLCITGPRLPDPRLLCRAPYRPDSGFPQWCALAIAHICFKKGIVFSGTWHGRNRDGAIRNSSNSQQSSNITMVIFLNPMFTSGTGFQSKKTLLNICKTSWQTPTFNLHAQLPSSSAFLCAGSPGREGCARFPVLGLLGLGDTADGECQLAGTELALGFYSG